MRLWLLLLLTGLFSSSCQSSKENTTLLLVQTLFRHGDRSPSRLYSSDPNEAAPWPEGLGKLTLIGRKQQYAVGKFLRSMYKDFVTSNPNEVLVNSSSADRCLRSAEALVAAFYAPEGIWKFEEGLSWQPIPIHYLPTEQDKYLSFASPCPRSLADSKRLYNSMQVQGIFQKHKKILDFISDQVGYNVSRGNSAFRLHDTLLIETIHNISIPEWAEQYWNEIGEVADAIYRSFFSSFTILRLRTGPLFEKIIENMERKINGSNPGMKVQVFSSHDNNLGAVLLALNFTNIPRPPYSATLILELHRMENNINAVRLLYLNSTRPESDVGEPHSLVLEGCSEFCPLEYFEKKIQPFIPESWERECQLEHDIL
ncbi:lysosomal acid phosphatase-like [Argiope bruennichi]|uniref:lysosomal acid phosphatase-like n=1 Tax=Argiope bruennichi TaxID=94029 RepID=UPI0024959A7B|nr:lysosomal acid phosphatase-like [Argiope bruennichi]XP_055948380.1 lysosomal acid phosphatase-like [Argiope bruennichi]XP_055948381.1 lysosomal acid phosphatase-like [Argiope bruennichi]